MPTRSHFLRSFGLCLLLLMSAIGSAPAGAQVEPPPGERGVVQRGDAVVTGFAPTLAPGPDLPVEIHPLDRTTIDPEGVTVRIFDLSQLGGGPEGQLSDAPVRHVLKAKDVGHVFGVAFDGDGSAGVPTNFYLTATSVHGLQLVAPGADGRLERVMTGRPGAQWMKGLFGDARGGGPGSIWKVDGRTGGVSLFADIKTGDLENSGAGLGAIAFDPRSRHLYVSDLETGLVWRLGLDGRLVDAFDHGTEGRAAAGLAFAAYDPATRTDRTEQTFNTEIPETWGFATPERRVWGLAVENSRLYYAVADGPAIWSVGLNDDGSFAGDARVEIDIKGTLAANQISTILFDGPAVMYLAQRGGQVGSYDYQTFMRPQEAMALRYQWNEAQRRWMPALQEYAVGMPPEHHGVVGGLALNYGYDRFGRIDYDRCRQTLWLTGEHLRAGSDIVRVSRGGPRLVDGLQGIYKSKVRPANEPPFEAWFVDYDADFAHEDAYGHIGNVAIHGPCKSSVTYSADRVEIPVWTGGPDLVVEKRCEPVAFGGRVKCIIIVRNRGDGPGEGVIEILDETRVLLGPERGKLLAIAEASSDGIEWQCGTNAEGGYACTLPAALLAAGATRELTVWVDTGEIVLGGNVGFRNCVTIDHPAGKGKACAEGGTGIVISKSGPAICAPGGDCTFAIAMTNASELPFKGDVVIADHMLVGGSPFAAPIVKIEPPLACQQQPAQLPFSCVAAVELAAGESLTHTITVTMPGPQPGFAQNCFAATDPWLADKPDLLLGLLAPAKFKGFAPAAASAHPACIWIKLGDPKKIVSPVKDLVAPVLGGALVPALGLFPIGEVCADGRPPLPSGRCACPLNAPWDPETRSCRWRPVCWDAARLAPDGRCCPRGTVWWASTGACRVPPTVGCTDVWRRTPEGRCCPSGQRWRDGACRPPVVTEPCGTGYRRLLSGSCIPVPGIPPVVELPKCSDGRPRLANGRCPGVVCPLNAPFNPRTGRCEPIRVSDCPPGFFRPAHANRCIPIAGGSCPGRLVRDASGKCVPPRRGGDHACGAGEVRVGGKCLERRQPQTKGPTKVKEPIRPPAAKPVPKKPIVREAPRRERAKQPVKERVKILPKRREKPPVRSGPQTPGAPLRLLPKGAAGHTSRPTVPLPPRRPLGGAGGTENRLR